MIMCMAIRFSFIQNSASCILVKTNFSFVLEQRLLLPLKTLPDFS